MSTDYKVYYETVTVNGFSCLIVMEKKSDSADLPQQAVLEKADVQSVCSGEMWL